MRWTDLAKRLLALAETIHRWMYELSKLEPERRERVAVYAVSIADTLARAADGLTNLQETAPQGREPTASRRAATRELARIEGYILTMVDVLEDRLDGRRLAGVKRRLESIGAAGLRIPDARAVAPTQEQIDRLYAAEGYFRALADGLRV